MNIRLSRTRLAVVAAALLAAPGLAAACSTCGCSLNSDWASQGYATSRGLHLSLRQDYFDQDAPDQRQRPRQPRQLRAARGRGSAEARRSTAIRCSAPTTASTATGACPCSCPISIATTRASAEGDTALSTSDGHGIGDMRVVARYQGFSPDARLGLQFGVKLATGSFKQAFIEGHRTANCWTADCNAAPAPPMRCWACTSSATSASRSATSAR